MIMPLLKKQVNPMEQRDAPTSASKFLRFLHFISFIAVIEENGMLFFKFVSVKTLLNILVVFFLCSFRMICLLAFEHEQAILHFGTIVELISMILVWSLSIIPVLQPMILRYMSQLHTYFSFSILQ